MMAGTRVPDAARARLAPLVRLARRMTGRERPVILMYHRVAAVARDPWEIAVRPERFDEQIAALAHARTVVPLSWLAAELRAGRLPRRTAAVTFDDGYADVLENAKPVLEKHGCPATLFLTTGAVGSVRGFWWDALVRILLETPVLPGRLSLTVAGRRYDWRLAEEDGEGGPGTAGALDRAALHEAVWRVLRPLAPNARWAALERLALWAGTDAGGRAHDRVMTADEVRRLSDPGFFDIGAHTVTHPSLPLVSDAEKAREVADSRRACEALTGRPAAGFAYPHGDLDAASVAAVRDAGLDLAVSTDTRAVRPGADPLRLPRVAVGDWTGAEFRRRVLHGF